MEENEVDLNYLKILIKNIVNVLGNLHKTDLKKVNTDFHDKKDFWRKIILRLINQVNNNVYIAKEPISRVEEEELIGKVELIQPSDFVWVHNDIWWRQFLWIPESVEKDKGRMMLLDLEDAVIGPWFYDLSSFCNSIMQQDGYCELREKLFRKS